MATFKETTILLGEFKRLAKLGHSLKVLASEQPNGYFALVAIDDSNPELVNAYSVRHARVDEPRTWRLDNLSQWLKETGISRFEVRYLCA